ncbi:MAG: hypothetical protein AAGD18_09715 [Actinomycetota bacterium]
MLQSLDRESLLERSRWLAAVSGGSYIAGAYFITASRSDKGAFSSQPPWSPGSPEERHLRTSTNYLAPGVRGASWFGLNIVYGLIFNYVPIALGFGLAGRLLGWIYAAGLFPSLKISGATRDPWLATQWFWLLLGLLFVAALIAVFVRRSAERFGGRGGPFAESAEGVASTALAATLVAGIITALGPLAVSCYRWVLGRFLEAASLGSVDESSFAGRMLFASLVIGGSILIGLFCLALNSVGRVRWLSVVGAIIATLGILVGPAVAAAEGASRAGLDETRDVFETVLFGVILVIFGVAFHNGRYSMHLLYKERLQAAYAVRRTHPNLPAEEIPWSERVSLTDVMGELRAKGIRLPDLIMCASVGLNDPNIPRGRYAASFSFQEVSSGGPLAGWRSTAKYEDAGGKMLLTLPAMMAISGAAVAPMMGRFTQRQFRALYALLNFRLGVWLPNPSHDYAERLSTERLRLSEPRGRNILKYLGALLRRARIGWYEPGGLYVLREAFGLSKGDLRFVHVADGGHLDNLGLIELVRRRAASIVCFDASASRRPLTADLRRTVSLVRSELEAEIVLDWAAVDRLDNDEGGDPILEGQVLYPDGSAGELIYVRAGVTADAPIDVAGLAHSDSSFPQTSTADQFFSDQEFEAYRALGTHLGGKVASRLRSKPEWAARPFE